MSTNFGPVPVNSVLPVFFGSYGKTNGESITLTGLATSDIQIYKGTSMTQRSSVSGFTLIDTDGIDVDSITGIHGFSIDLSDNTDASFYAAGNFYTVVVSTVTVDSQTLSFVAATFRIVASDGADAVTVSDALLNRDMSIGTDSGSTSVRTPRQAFRFLRNKFAISAGTLTVYKEDDATSSWTGSVTDSTSANPIIANDPAGP